VGAIDEASAALGAARAQINLPEFHELIKAIQMDLSRIMTQVSLETPDPDKFPSAALGMARSIIRRAERETVALHEKGLLTSENALPYLNRLSSLCFVLELATAENPPLEGN